MSPFSIRYVCKLDSEYTYYEYSVWVLKLGMTEWYQSGVDSRNASLVRRVIFSRLFSNQNYFYSTLFKISILQLIFVICLIFSSTFTTQMANDGRCNCNNGDNNDVQNPPSTLE
jgi:hypothetical protein